MKHNLSPKQLSLIVLISLGVIALGIVYVVAGSVMERIPKTEVAAVSDAQPKPVRYLPPASQPLSTELSPAQGSETEPPASTSPQKLPAKPPKEKRQKPRKKAPSKNGTKHTTDRPVLRLSF